MNGLDWVVLIGYFGVMVAIGVWSHKRVDNASDFFTAGGKMPWWLSGISHHMSGYSAVMFTGYAGIAYTYGVTSFVTWSFPIAPGIALNQGIFITGAITAIYCTIGGLWADALTELGQFIIQLLAGVSMFVAVVVKLNDKNIGFFDAWNRPELHGHDKPLVGQYGAV